MKKPQALQLLLVASSFGLIGSYLLHSSFAAYSVPDLLQRFTPGVTHEAKPHGVPIGYDWQARSTVTRTDPPNSEMTYLNIRGDMYVDESNKRAPNTRVAIKDCQAWGLLKSSNTWEKFIDLSPGKLDGRGWKEDFSTNDGAGRPYTNIRTEADGSRSAINYDGYNFHYFNAIAQAPLVNVGNKYGEFVTACSAKLVLDNPAGADDRGNSAYLISTGNDWKKSDNSCTTNQFGATLCYAIGSGKFIRVSNSWRRVVYSTMNSSALSTKPMPPESVFLNPDGSFGDSSLSQNSPLPGATPSSNSPSKSTSVQAQTSSSGNPNTPDPTSTKPSATSPGQTVGSANPISKTDNDKKETAYTTKAKEQRLSATVTKVESKVPLITAISVFFVATTGIVVAAYHWGLIDIIRSTFRR